MSVRGMFAITPNSEVGEHARPGRRWLRPRSQPFTCAVDTNACNFFVRPGFPRGRGKQRPRRARSHSTSEFGITLTIIPLTRRAWRTFWLIVLPSPLVTAKAALWLRVGNFPRTSIRLNVAWFIYSSQLMLSMPGLLGRNKLRRF